VLAFLLVIRGLGTVPAALVEREIDFRTRARCELTGALVQAGVSIGLAATGFGVWSLVFGQLAGTGVQTALFWVVVPWKPQLRLASARELRELLRYGRFVSAGNIVNLANNTLDNVFIGRLLGASLLGLYTVAFRIADFPNTVIGHVVGRVMFPVYARLREDSERLKRAYLRNIERTAFFAVPISAGLAVAAEPLVLGLLGEKWAAAVTPLRILAIYGLLKTIFAPSGEVLKGIGKPHVGLAFGAAQLAVLAAALALLAPRFGLEGAAGAMLVAVATGGGAKFVASLRAVGAGGRETARALGAPAACASVVAATLAVLVPATDALTPVLALALLVAAGALAYLGAAAVFARSVVAPIWAGWRNPEIGAAR
jgi:lipopolysaccharide exporter